MGIKFDYLLRKLRTTDLTQSEADALYAPISHIHQLEYTVKTDDYDILSSDLNTALGMDSVDEHSFNLLATDSDMVGKEIMFVKVNSGRVNIVAPTGEFIVNSSSGGTIYNPFGDQNWATITLKLISVGRWAIRSIDGDWIVT